MSVEPPNKARLYLIPVPLGESSIEAILPPEVKECAQALKYFVAENAKSARAFLKLLPSQIVLQQIDIQELNARTEAADLVNLLEPLRQGFDLGLISEAGCPAVADPGSNLVALAQAQGFQVCPLVGPSSILLALMGSGLSGQNFAFHGYLPIKDELRAQKISALEKDSRLEKRTQIFIETPYRNRQMLAALIKHCAPTSRICTASDLTLASETIISASVLDWRQREKRQQLPELDRRPTVFLLQA